MLKQSRKDTVAICSCFAEAGRAEALIAAFGEFQLLYALRDSPHGVSGVNEQLEQMLGRRRAITLPRHSA